MERLSEDDVRRELAGLEGWAVEHGELVRSWKFADFAEAMGFVNRVGAAAESAKHHPDIDIRYNRVRLGLVTHDSGGITLKDVGMAREINGLAAGPKLHDGSL
jgi:4a-hydroxytetrahydrobiopterin dehydratase